MNPEATDHNRICDINEMEPETYASVMEIYTSSTHLRWLAYRLRGSQLVSFLGLRAFLVSFLVGWCERRKWYLLGK